MPDQTAVAARRRTLLWVLGLAFVLRLVLAAATAGYPYDLSCFTAWGDKLLAGGPRPFLQRGLFRRLSPRLPLPALAGGRGCGSLLGSAGGQRPDPPAAGRRPRRL